jgi:hypothetical protein
MRTYTIPNSELALRIHYSRRDIERMASDELRRGNCLPAEPQPILLEKYLRRVHDNLQPEIERLPDGILGQAQLTDPFKPRILIARSVFEGPMARYRSTLAHEIGHLVLHRHLFLDPKGLPTYLEKRHRGGLERGFACGEGQINEHPRAPLHKDDPIFHLEYQANLFMASASVPENLLRLLIAPHIRVEIQRGGGKIEVLDEAARRECVGLIAERFGVSRTLAGYRLEAFFPKTTFPKDTAPASTGVLEAGWLF